MTTLISFLGRSHRRSAAGGAEQRGYTLTSYRFASGTVRETPFFGAALAAELAVDRAVFVGTAGSMWDFFVDQVAESEADSVLALSDAVDRSEVDESMLHEYREQLGARLGLPADRVACRVIPLAATLDEQLDIVGRIGELVTEGEEIALDVTHGFRHLPMLALVAARYLEKARGVRVREICYGAREMTREGEEAAPVVTLTGLLRTLGWIDALTLHDHGGAYAAFADLFQEEGLPEPAANMLRRASYQEHVNNVAGARASLDEATRGLREAELGPHARLFREPLLERFEWTREENDGAREFALAELHLTRGDYLRGAILIREGAITRSLARSGGDAASKRDRDDESEKLHKRHEPIKELQQLRNAIVHGLRSSERGQATLDDESLLSERLRLLLRDIRNLSYRS